MTGARRSIAFRLIAAVLLVELASAVLVIALSWGYERHAHFRAFDVMLRGRADSVLGAVQDAEDAADNVMLDKADLHLPADDIYEVWDESGRLLGRTSNWPGTGGTIPMPPRDGYSRMIVNQRHYRVLRLRGSRIVDPDERGGGKLRQVTVLYGAPTRHLWHAIVGTVEVYAAGSLLLLFVTGPLIAWLLHRGLQPLRQLAALAGRVTVDDWQFSPPASAHTTPELAPLTHALESALQRLERAFTQQRTFVSDAAHELKTAVAVVKSSLQLLVLKPRTAEEYRHGLERCLADTGRLEDLVAKMLTLARVESGAAAAALPARSDINHCVRQTAAQLSTIAAQRGVRMSLPEQDALLPVALTAEDCSLLVSNLLLNALQHSPAGSTAAIRLASTGSTAELVVEDRGEGIDPAALPHVFDRFYRGDPSRARATGGTGLGLAICKGIVEKAGGSIAIASVPGQSTTVTVSLPTA
ncbi:MAG TPA: ATP-binding protein [Terracidiphilus sp.]|nr:ATP-binding protein [Terracidiphilus sp.]